MQLTNSEPKGVGIVPQCYEDIKVGTFHRYGHVFSEIIAVKDSNLYAKLVIAGHLGLSVTTINYRDTNGAVYGAQHGSLYTKEDVEYVVAKGSEVGYTIRTAPLVFTSTKYGTCSEVAVDYLNSSFAYVRNEVYRFLQRTLSTEFSYSLDVVVGVYEPLACRDGSISIYRTVKDKKRDRRTSLKAGRAFKHMFHTMPDKTVAELAEGWIEQKTPRQYTFHTGRTRADFAHAYGHTRTSYRNPITTYARKSLASSCMHGAYRYLDGKEISLAEAYASGDFEVAWLEDVDGYIGGRVVYSIAVGHDNATGPVYGACEKALDTLEEHVSNLSDDTDMWSGLDLLLIGPEHDPVVPYLDSDIQGEVFGGKIRLCSRGDFAFDSTDGYVSTANICCSCEERVDEHDLFGTDRGDMCECCFNEFFTVLDSGETVDAEDATEAYFVSNDGRIRSALIHIEEAVYCEGEGEYWCIDCVTINEVGEATPTHLIPDQLEEELEFEC